MGMRREGYGLSFIADEVLYQAVDKLVGRVRNSLAKADPYANVVDPFSAVFESALVIGANSKDWLEVERGRQTGKSLANAIGDFHQELIGGLPGWKSTGANGGVVDLIHSGAVGPRETPVLAELKNKHNTMNSSSAEALHSRFQDLLKLPQFKGYTAYLIEVIPRKPGGTEAPWAPSGRGEVERIRKVDAATVYSWAAGGDVSALRRLFDALPSVLVDVCGDLPDLRVIAADPGFGQLFGRAI